MYVHNCMNKRQMQYIYFISLLWTIPMAFRESKMAEKKKMGGKK